MCDWWRMRFIDRGFIFPQGFRQTLFAAAWVLFHGSAGEALEGGEDALLSGDDVAFGSAEVEAAEGSNGGDLEDVD
jgi:hypothetical protein